MSFDDSDLIFGWRWMGKMACIECDKLLLLSFFYVVFHRRGYRSTYSSRQRIEDIAFILGNHNHHS